MERRLVKVLAIAAIAAVLSACGGRSGPSEQSDPLVADISTATVPPSGITSIDDVKITDNGSRGTYFEGVSSAAFSMSDVLAVLYCRAARYRIENGYTVMAVKKVVRQGYSRNNSPQAIAALLTFHRDPVPENVKPLTKDWCAVVPPAAQSTPASPPAS